MRREYAVPLHLAIASVAYAKSRPDTDAAGEAVRGGAAVCLEILTVQSRHRGVPARRGAGLYAAIPAGLSSFARSCRRGTQLATIYDVWFGRYAPRYFERRSHGQIHL